MKSVILRLLSVAFVGATLGACALTEDKVPVDYVPFTNREATSALAGAASVALNVTVTDQRTQYADRISTKKNTYGMEMARIVASNDVPTVVRQALEQELRLLGFRIEAGGMPVGVELQNFYNNFKVGFFSGDAVAEVAFAVKVRDAGGALVYSQFYSATETEANIMLASGENAKKALEKALASAVKRAIEDRALQQALLATRPAQPQQRRVGS